MAATSLHDDVLFFYSEERHERTPQRASAHFDSLVGGVACAEMAGCFMWAQRRSRAYRLGSVARDGRVIVLAKQDQGAVALVLDLANDDSLVGRLASARGCERSTKMSCWVACHGWAFWRS